MVRFWRRKAQQDTRNAQPAAVPADLVAWAQEADVSRLSDRTVRDAEDYLKGYRYMNLDLSQQMGWRVIAAVEAQVTPSPPAFAQQLDVIATVVALRRKQLGTGLSSPSALVLPSLGYGASGSGLRRLGRSPLCNLTSPIVWEVVVYRGLHLPVLGRYRRVSFTDWFTGCEGSPRWCRENPAACRVGSEGLKQRGRQPIRRGVRGGSPALRVRALQIRRSGHFVRDRPSLTVCWADVPHLSAAVGR
jgi:hypothetical protein